MERIKEFITQNLYEIKGLCDICQTIGLISMLLLLVPAHFGVSVKIPMWISAVVMLISSVISYLISRSQ